MWQYSFREGAMKYADGIINDLEMIVRQSGFINSQLMLVDNSQEVRSIHGYFPTSKEYDAFFVIIENGDYAAVWGFYGSVPYTGKNIYRIV